MKKTIPVLFVVLVFIFQIAQAQEWYKDFTKTCETLGGLERGSYNPGAYITRGEVATLVNKVRKTYNIPIKDSGKKDFKDINEINESKNKSDILELAGGSIINGYLDGTFAPKKLISRAEFAKIICCFWDISNENIPSEIPFCDTPKNAWYYNYVSFVYSKGIINGYNEGETVKFKPDNNITFAESAKMTLLSSQSVNIGTQSTPLPTPTVTPSSFITHPEPTMPLSQGTSHKIVFSDINLENAVKKYLKKNTSDVITQSEAEKISILIIDDSSISDLTGLSYFKNLTSLDLCQNNISNISELSYLKKLDSLKLDSNNVSDLSPLNSLENLTFFSAERNKISDLSPLLNNVNLKSLFISRNLCSDISKLSGLPNLEVLDISFNGVKDINVLASLKKLKTLYMVYNKIEDISAIRDLPMIILYLESNPIKDYSPIQKLDLRLTDYVR